MKTSIQRPYSVTSVPLLFKPFAGAKCRPATIAHQTLWAISLMMKRNGFFRRQNDNGDALNR